VSILGLRSLLWVAKEFILLAIDQTLDHYRKDKQMDNSDIVPPSDVKTIRPEEDEGGDMKNG